MNRFIASVIAAALWLIAQGANALDLPGPLVDADWLANKLDQVKVLELRHDPRSFAVEPQYAISRKTGRKVLVEVGGHVPGSVWIDFSKVRVTREIAGQKVGLLIPAKADFEALVRSWGVNRGDAIVLVPLGESIGDLNEAARLYWQFKYYGEDRVAILNGDSSAWLSAQKPFSTQISTPVAGNWTAGAERTEIFASSEDTALASAGKGGQLVDARPIAQHYGLSKSGAVTKAGHIAGSKLAAAELLSRTSGGAQVYLDAASYTQLMTKLGISTKEPTISYCNTGHQAAGLWFVMSELLGNKGTKLYDGSLHQWTLEKRPVVGLAD